MKMTKLISSIVLGGLLIGLTGCASIAGDNTRQVHVSSNKPGAKIYVDNQQYGTTPATIILPNYIYGGKAVTVKKAGFGEQTKVVNTVFQPVSILNVLSPGWIGWLIDAGTGNLVKIDPASRNLDYSLATA